MTVAIFSMLASFWDWIDKRDIDKHLLSVFVMLGTIRVTQWAMAFASLHHDDGNAPLIIAAVTAPYMVLQGAAIKFYFDVRSQS